MNYLELITFNNEKDYGKWREKINKETAQLMDSVYIHYMQQCENADQRRIFHDWWHGVSVCQDEYASSFSEEDNYEAGNWIQEAVSRGFG